MEPVILNNTYRLESRLTAGGMGAVFVGSHLRIKGRKYAIKKLHADLATNVAFQKRFAAEAEAMMELSHENIVRIEDFLVEGEDYYLVMEFVEGEPLDALLHREKTLSSYRASELFRQLLLGLEACHAKGIIHRDLKPSNLLLSQDGTLKITDFGIARQKKADRGLTKTGTILGTPDYMSPEQIVGEKPDHRSDLYSCGVILYEMLVGRTPYLSAYESDNNYAILYAHLNNDPDPITDPDVSPNLKKLIQRCLEKRPQDRLQSTKDALRLLKQGKEDTNLDPSTRDWQKLGLEGRPGPDSLGKASKGGGNRERRTGEEFRLKRGPVTGDFDRDVSPPSSNPTEAVPPDDQYFPTKKQTAHKQRRSSWMPAVVALSVVLAVCAGVVVAFLRPKNPVDATKTTPPPPHQRSAQVTVQGGNDPTQPSKQALPTQRRKDPTPPGVPVVPQGGSSRGKSAPPPVGAVRKTPRSAPPLVARRPAKLGRHPGYNWPAKIGKLCRFFLKICMKSCIRSRQKAGDARAEDSCRRPCWKSRASTNGRKFCQ